MMPTAALMLACYQGQLARVKAGCGYGVGLARTREVERLEPIVAALEAFVEHGASAQTPTRA